MRSTPELGARLVELEEADLVHRLAEEEPSFTFKHTLTQQAAYQSLLQKRRRVIHRLVARSYEAAYADRLEQFAAIIAKHYAEAGEAAETYKYATLAGDVAARAYANPEALMHYTLALQVAEREPAGLDAPRFNLKELYLKRGRVLEVSNRHADALANYQEMEEWARAHGDREIELAALMARATVLSIPSGVIDLKQGQALAQAALEIASELADHSAEAKILWILMLIGYFGSRLSESVQFGERSIALARQFGLREQLAYSLNDISRVYVAAGKLDQAQASQNEAGALWRELGNLPLLADQLVNSANFYFVTADWEEGSRALDEALRLAHQIGNLWSEAYADMTLGYMHFIRGQMSQCVQVIQESILLGSQAGALFTIPNGHAMLSWLYGELGDADGAVELGEQAMAEVKKYFFLLAPTAYAVLAHARLVQGDLPAAESLLEKSHVNFDTYNFDGLQPYFVLITECRLALAQSDFERTSRVSDQLLFILRGAGIRVFVPDVLYCQGRMLLGCARADEARTVLHQARAMAEETGERLSLLRILSTLSELDEQRGDASDAQTWKSQAHALAEQLARDVPPSLQTFFSQFKSS